MTIVLLVIILLLLVVIITMMVSGWPGRERMEIEKIGSISRREMAEYHGESIRLLQTIRTEVEDAIQESFDREMGTFVRDDGVAQVLPQRLDGSVAENNPKKRTVKRGRANVGEVVTASGDRIDESAANALLRARQISLFPEEAQPVTSVSYIGDEDMGKELEKHDIEAMEKIHVTIHDDIPDIDDIPDVDDVK